jgi:hypothetical protein
MLGITDTSSIFILIIMLKQLLFGVFLTFASCMSEQNKETSASLPHIAQWCTPDLEFRGFDQSVLSDDEKGEWQFILNGLEKIFEHMCVEYFNDRPGNKDSYKMTVQLPNEVEPHTEFGEYELLASGKRLIMYMPNGKKLNIEVNQLDETKQQWRLQMQDLFQFSGDHYNLPSEMPEVIIYMTFHKK